VPRRDPLDAIRPILVSFSQTHREIRRLLDEHVGPAVRSLWATRAGASAEPIVTQYNTPPVAPAVSVIVPLYGRFDFIEHQLAHFVDDPDVARSDLIYVVDDPSIYDDVRLLCLDVGPFYQVPFRVVYGRRNAGFAGACNLGASLARGQYILLLNSDVLPKRPGWLAELVRAYEMLPHAGAIAPKLLYEDHSIQHAGMRFARLPIWGDMWINDHPYKGQINRPEREPVEFPSVTGACMLIERALYEQVGGLSEDYVIGDFEDSDLCLKLLAAGRRNWLVPDVELYHLERQSQDRVGPDWRVNLSLYNCWTHTGRWDAAISRLAGSP
jgi:GT2 family glycosyltransferase